MIKVQVINKSSNKLPAYETPGSAGCDALAELSTVNEKFLFNATVNDEKTSLIINPGGRALIPTENYMSIPEGYEVQVRPRSGLALKHGITVANTPGTVDSDYRNSVGIILLNLGHEPFRVNQGDRIGQYVLNKVEQIEWVEVDSLDETQRGLGGFGHTGK